jgi:hypothetical protein
MNWQIFPSPTGALIAVIGGLLFGFLLRKSTLSRFDTMVGQLLLKDFTLLKVVLTLALTASVLIFIQDLIGQRVVPMISITPIKMSLIGGAIFGAGLAITGYGPETMAAAIGEGKKEALTGMAGLILGSILYAIIYSRINIPMTQCNAISTSNTLSGVVFPELVTIFVLASLLGLVGYYTRKV